jgi:beta-exotoxin I transport system permease protein
MSLAQLRRTLADGGWMLFWFAIGLAGYGALIAAFWPTLKEAQDVYAQLVKALPEAVIKAFGITSMADFAGFIGTEYLNLFWGVIVSVFVIMMASSFVAGEIDRGTVELWLSVPAPRWRLLGAKLIAFLLQISVLVVVSSVSLAVVAYVIDVRLPVGSWVALTIVLGSFCLAVGGYTSLLSAAASSRGAAGGIAAGVTFMSYLAGVISGLSTNVEGLKYVSILTAFHPQRALEGASYASEASVLGAIGVACALASLVVFQRRDANP